MMLVKELMAIEYAITPITIRPTQNNCSTEFWLVMSP